jgi:hypothetical protein
MYSIVVEMRVLGYKKQGRWRFFGGFLSVFPVEDRIPNTAALFRPLEDGKCTRKTPKDYFDFHRESLRLLSGVPFFPVKFMSDFPEVGFTAILRDGLSNGDYNTWRSFFPGEDPCATERINP